MSITPSNLSSQTPESTMQKVVRLTTERQRAVADIPYSNNPMVILSEAWEGFRSALSETIRSSLQLTEYSRKLQRAQEGAERMACAVQLAFGSDDPKAQEFAVLARQCSKLTIDLRERAQNQNLRQQFVAMFHLRAGAEHFCQSISDVITATSDTIKSAVQLREDRTKHFRALELRCLQIEEHVANLKRSEYGVREQLRIHINGNNSGGEPHGILDKRVSNTYGKKQVLRAQEEANRLNRKLSKIESSLRHHENDLKSAEVERIEFAEMLDGIKREESQGLVSDIEATRSILNAGIATLASDDLPSIGEINKFEESIFLPRWKRIASETGALLGFRVIDKVTEINVDFHLNSEKLGEWCGALGIRVPDLRDILTEMAYGVDVSSKAGEKIRSLTTLFLQIANSVDIPLLIEILGNGKDSVAQECESLRVSGRVVQEWNRKLISRWPHPNPQSIENRGPLTEDDITIRLAELYLLSVSKGIEDRLQCLTRETETQEHPFLSVTWIGAAVK